MGGGGGGRSGPGRLARAASRLLGRLRQGAAGRSGQRGADRTGATWGSPDTQWRPGGGLHWMELEAVRRRVNRKISGDPARDGYQLFLDVLAGHGVPLPLDRALTLGCGFGELERGLAQYGFCRQHVAYDLSEAAIRHAREAAAAAGLDHVSYEVRDLDRPELPRAAFDAVLGVQSIHHLRNLEGVLDAVREALRPGGFFVLDEYVGPRRLQWTERQVGVVDALLGMMPAELRVGHDGRLKTRLRRHSLREMDRVDPSEAIRSDEILPLLAKRFSIVERRDYGGTVLHPLLDGIAGNFAGPHPAAGTLLGMLFDVEDALLAAGVLASDFVFVVARRD